jgi:YesN/AraC family two-component response regulator
MEKKVPISFYTIEEVVNISGSGQLQAEGIHVSALENIGQIIPFQAPYRSNQYTVMLMQKGAIHVKVDLLDYTAKKDDLLFIAPNATKQFVEASEDCAFIVLVFTQDFLTQTIVNIKHIDAFDFFSTQSAPLFRIEQEDADLLYKHLLLLQEKTLSRPAHPFHMEILKHAFMEWLYEWAAIYMRLNAMNKVQMTRKENLVMRFLKILMAHFKEERSVQYYAGQLYISPKYLTETVKEVTGKTAGELIDESVIMEAKILLSNTQVPVAQVARELYFSDQFFFSKYFKKHTGLTPSEYRKES